MSGPRLRRLATRDLRAIVLGALVVAPVLGYASLVKPYLAALTATREATERERALLQREVGLLARVPQLPREIQLVRQTSAVATGMLFPGGDAMEATSALTSYVGHALRDANVAVQQIESRDAGESTQGLREITIDVRAEGSLAGVLRALRALESGNRLVRVTRVSLERALVPSSGASETLLLSATARGYARQPGAMSQ